MFDSHSDAATQSLLTGFSLGVLGSLITVFFPVFLQCLDVLSDPLLHHSRGLNEVAHLILSCFLFCQLFLDLPLYEDRPELIRTLLSKVKMPTDS